jgi:hypothetical protein
MPCKKDFTTLRASQTYRSTSTAMYGTPSVLLDALAKVFVQQMLSVPFAYKHMTQECKQPIGTKGAAGT